MKYSRISFLIFLCSMFCAIAPAQADDTAAPKRPWLFVTGDQVDGLRSLADVRQAIKSGHSRQLWNELVEKVEQDRKTPAITMENRNSSYTWVARASFRIIDSSLVALIKHDRQYAEVALEQLAAVFDEKKWPEWRDSAHARLGMNADLRHGQLVRAIGLAYDWLYPLMTLAERQSILEGLNRRAIPQFKAGLKANEHWGRRHSNWMTCVIGGFGILGMALGDDHPDAKYLVEAAQPRMQKYMSVIGPEGEFNESVGYAGSTMYVVDYFTADFYASRGRKNRLQEFRLDKYCTWYMYSTLPPGRVFGFGDGHPSSGPNVGHLGAIASVLRNPEIQWFYLQYRHLMHPGHRQRALELLFFDPSVESQSPAGRLPLGRAYQHQAKLFSSRSSWDPDQTTSIVYGKAGQEDYHGHADWGQVCIDGFGERLVVDHGSPRGGYPLNKKERYYNYQQQGHNVLVIGQNETGGVPVQSRLDGELLWSRFDDKEGAAWSIDLSPVYQNDRQVTRTVAHLLPRTIVVLDEATLPNSEDVSLRWHTSKKVQPDSQGRFLFQQGKATLSGCVIDLNGKAAIQAGHHLYKAPFDKNRYGVPYKQSKPPFVELSAQSQEIRFLSLFCLFGEGEEASLWTPTAGGWEINTPEGPLAVKRDSLDRLFKQGRKGTAQ